MDPHGLVQKVELIEIQRNDFVLGVAGLELQGNDPLLEFLKDPPDFGGSRFVEHLFGQLLGQGGAPALGTETDQRPSQGPEVYAGMLVKALVLGGDQGLHQMGGQLLVFGMDAVLFKKSPHHFAIGVQDLGSQKTLWIRNFLGRGQGAKGPNPGQEKTKEDGSGNGEDRNPEEADFAPKIPRGGIFSRRHQRLASAGSTDRPMLRIPGSGVSRITWANRKRYRPGF